MCESLTLEYFFRDHPPKLLSRNLPTSVIIYMYIVFVNSLTKKILIVCSYLHQVNIELSSPILAKKSRPSDQGCDRDWEDLLKSHHHNLFVSTQDHVAGLGQASLKEEVKTGNIPLDTGAVLFQHIPAILFALHLVYEVSRLHC